MEPTTKLHMAALLLQARHAADSDTNGLLDRDELASVIRELVANTQQLLLESEDPALWPEHVRGPRRRDLI